MSLHQRQSIISIDDDPELIIIDGSDDELEILNRDPIARHPTASFKHPLPKNQSLSSLHGGQAATSVDSNDSSHSNSPFGSVHWGFPKKPSATETVNSRVYSNSSSGSVTQVQNSPSLNSYPHSPISRRSTVLPISDTEILITRKSSAGLGAPDLRPVSRGVGHENVNRTYSISSGTGSDECLFISLEEDEEDEVEIVGEGPSALSRSLNQHPAQGDVLIDLDDYDDRWSQEPEVQLSRTQDAAVRDRITIVRRKSSHMVYPQRNPPIVGPFTRLETLQHQGLLLRQGKTVELIDGDFLRIKDIVHNSENDQVMLRGHRLQRCSSMNGMLEKKLNEVCLFYEEDLDDPRPIPEQSVVEVPIASVIKLRNVRWTIHKFPVDRNIVMSDYESQVEAATKGGLTVRWKYTCKYASAGYRFRNDYIERTLERIKEDELPVPLEGSNVSRRFEWRGDTIPGGSYQPLITPDDNIPESILHGENAIYIPGNSSDPEISFVDLVRSNSISVVTETRKRKCSHTELQQHPTDLTRKRLRQDDVEEAREGVERMSLEVSQVEPKPESLITTVGSSIPTARIPSSLSSCIPSTRSIQPTARKEMIPKARGGGQMLTYGDAFCGGGGTTRGAAMAGLKVKWGFDFSKHACETWRTNFPNSRCYSMASHQFVQLAQRAARKGFPDAMKVDILHMSPPCQYFSDAHTVDGKDDEMNTASLFAVRDVIAVAKPRIATLEQTFGITRSKFMWYLAALIQMFTSLDFSVRWAVVHLAQWGLPQRRRRLIIIAACPGEILPHIPVPTHSDVEADNLKPFSTVNQALSQVRPNAPDHDPESILWGSERYMKPYNGNMILPRAMTTSGGQNYHPSGHRDFTIREYATLQGFPPNHVFKGSYVKKQIGNAVPPCVAKVLFESIKKELDEADGIVDEREVMVIE